MPEDHALVVGVTRYPQLDGLEGPEEDARDFFEWVTSADGGRVPAENARLIRSSDFAVPPDENGRRPTAEAVEEELERLWTRGQSEGQFGGRLYLYFAGHGVTPVEDGMPQYDESALLMANAAKGRFPHVAGRAYADHFRAAAYFREIVLFMDCCREHMGRVQLTRPPWEPVNAQTPARVCYAFSSDWNRKAREARWSSPDAPVRGLFSAALMSVLRRGVPSGTTLTSRELENRVYNEMTRIATAYAATASPAAEGPASGTAGAPTWGQEPQWYRQERGTPITFSPRGARTTITVALTGTRVGTSVTLKDGTLRVLTPDASSPERWVWEIEAPGLYVVSTSDGATALVELTTLTDGGCHVTL